MTTKREFKLSAQSAVGFSHGQRLIAHKMQADDSRHRAGCGITKVTAHRLANHFPQLLDGITLGGDGVAERTGDPAENPALKH